MNLQISSSDDRQHKIELDVDQANLGKFIGSLLGQPQTLEKRYICRFDIDLNWLLNLHEIINQRISQQNQSTLVSFGAVIYYENGFQRTLSDVSSLKYFNETKKIISQGVSLHWTYLIKFPNKSNPEKQDIYFYADVDTLENNQGSDFENLLTKYNPTAVLKFHIAHTERTFADDLESLIDKEINKITKNTEWFGKFATDFFIILSLIIFFTAFIYPEYLEMHIQKKLFMEFQNQYNLLKNIEIKTINSYNNKIDALIYSFMNYSSGKIVPIFYKIIIVVVGLFFAAWTYILAKRKKASFITLTKEAVDYKEKTIKKEKRSYFYYLLSTIFTITTGVLGNYVYDYLK